LKKENESDVIMRNLKNIEDDFRCIQEDHSISLAEKFFLYDLLINELKKQRRRTLTNEIIEELHSPKTDLLYEIIQVKV
jgi:hypothetical protein